MSLKLEHILVNRFHLPNFSTNKQLSKNDITSDENYLDDRFQLFFKYTVPSVISQTWKDFLWYVFFSDRTPDKYINILDYNHVEVDRYFDVVAINNDKPLWLEVIHSSNVSNCMRNHVNTITSYTSFKELFSIDLNVENSRIKNNLYVKFGRILNLFRRLKQHGFKWVFSIIKDHFIQQEIRGCQSVSENYLDLVKITKSK